MDLSTIDCSGQSANGHSAKVLLTVYNHPFLQAKTWFNTNRLVVNAIKFSVRLLGNIKYSDYLQHIPLNNV